MITEGNLPSIPAYIPPPQFKLLNTPPLLQEGLPDNADLWLVRIQDSHLKADEFNAKQISLALNTTDGRMGYFESSKGSQYEILDLQDVAAVQPFAFLPKGDSALEVSKISRQVAIVRSLDPVGASRPFSKGEELASPKVDASRSLSTGTGGPSSVESLQDDEDRISTGKVEEPSKKARRASLNPERNLSPFVGHPQKDMDVEEQASSKKKSHKHRKMDSQNSELELSPSVAHPQKDVEVEEHASSKKKSDKHRKTESRNLEPNHSPVRLLHTDMEVEGPTTSKRKSRKHRKSEEGHQNSELDLSPVRHSQKDLEVEEQASSKKKSPKHRKIEGQNSDLDFLSVGHQNSELLLSPERHSQKDLEAQEQTSSKRKSRKHRKIEG